MTFHITEGPKVKIREVDFVGNKAISDGKLATQMKENKGQGLVLVHPRRRHLQGRQVRRGRRQVVAVLPRPAATSRRRVGQPELKILEDSKDGKTRWVELRVPVTEGKRYRVGKFEFEGNTIVNAEGAAAAVQAREGRVYSEKKIRKGFEKAQGGLRQRRLLWSSPAIPISRRATRRTDGRRRDGRAGRPPPAAPRRGHGRAGPPIVDVTLRVQEGKQYFVNRITFSGNTTTRDNVIRREIRLVESGVFNTEALKYSIKRLNQLGYFKPLEGRGDLASRRRRAPTTRSTSS